MIVLWSRQHVLHMLRSPLWWGLWLLGAAIGTYWGAFADGIRNERS